MGSGWPNQKRVRPLTIKEHAVVDGVLAGKERHVDIGLSVFNTTSRSNAAKLVQNVLKREVVKNEIEKRMAAQKIVLDRHLKNIDKLAFEGDKEDIRLRASQDLLDRGGLHYKYFADDGKPQVEIDLTDDQFSRIVNKYSNSGNKDEKENNQVID